MELGATIRARRSGLGLSLEALAERSGVSRAMLSDIERGAKSPTVRVVSQIAEGLGCSVSELLGEPLAAGSVLQVLRSAERQILVDPYSGVQRHLLAPPFVRHGLEVLWYVVPPGQATGNFPAHRAGVEEHFTVARGVLRFTLGEQHVDLSAGDSIVFRADQPHGFENLGDEPVELFLIIDASRVSGLR